MDHSLLEIVETTIGNVADVAEAVADIVEDAVEEVTTDILGINLVFLRSICKESKLTDLNTKVVFFNSAMFKLIFGFNLSILFPTLFCSGETSFEDISVRKYAKLDDRKASGFFSYN